MSEPLFVIVDFDGYNVALRDASFAQTHMEFESFEDALAVAEHWEKWIKEEL